MANNLANYAETAVVDWLMGGATPTRPPARFVALHTGDHRQGRRLQCRGGGPLIRRV